MSTTLPDRNAPPAPTEPPADRTPWLRVLAGLTATIAVVEVVFLTMIATLVPPIVAGIVLTALGIGLLRRAPRTGIVVLGSTSLLLLIGFAPFAGTHLSHPESAIDFTHAVVGTAGRVLAVIAAVGAFRAAGPAGARRLGIAAVGLTGLTVAIAGIATVASTGDEPRPDDVVTVIASSQFDDAITVVSGDTLYVDNTDVFRHTFTVSGTTVDVELPAAVGVRIPIDLAAGEYVVICDIPGHEAMTSMLRVQ